MSHENKKQPNFKIDWPMYTLSNGVKLNAYEKQNNYKHQKQGSEIGNETILGQELIEQSKTHHHRKHQKSKR